jgi:hypothetical protein
VDSNILAFLLTESIQTTELAAETVGFESVAMIAGPDRSLAKKRIAHTSKPH